jgi:Cd2+/Zn2+-exporting ATPase
MEQETELMFDGKWYAYPPMRDALIAGFLIGLAFGLGHLGIIPHLFEISIYAVAIILGGYRWSKEGIEKLIEEKEIGIEMLMMAAAIGSAILGMWDEAAFLVFLYGAAEGLEEFTYAKTKHSIKKLLKLVPKEARLLKEGKEAIVPAEDVEVGNIFLVKPGESIPTDGLILNGRSSVNEAPVTGESIPVEKKEGKKVFASTINQEGALEIKATATFKDNSFSKMIHLVEEAQEKKGKTQLFIDRFARVYSPLVLLSGFLLMVIPPLLGLSFTDWATRAVVLLVAAAPCALVMSTPVAIAAGIGKAGHAGVLIKGGVPLENLGKIKVVAFDKTGTLTKGEPKVTDILPLNGNENDVLRFAYSVNKYSEHPLGRAIVQNAEESGVESVEVTDFSSIAGYGAKGHIEGTAIFVGKPELFQKCKQSINNIPEIEKFKNEGKTIVLVGTEESITGIIAIRDELRPEAKQVIKELHHMGIKSVMVTGDSEIVAKAIAKEIGVDEYWGNLRPQDKIEVIKTLKEKYGPTAMVGDGINDSPALAGATVGIAMGAAGTDAAIEAADVALMADDIKKVPQVISLGKRSRQISNQNIVFSLLVLSILIPSALIGFMSVAVAVFFHEASELMAVGNGLRVARN